MKRILFLINLIIIFAIGLTYQKTFAVHFDHSILLFFEDIRNGFLTQFFKFFSDVGSINFLFPLAVIVSIYLAFKRKFIDIILLMAVVWGARGANFLLKEWIKRERPSFHPLIELHDYSFPSGHAMNAAAVYSVLCYLLLKVFRSRTNNVFWLLFTIVTVLLIAMSRIYIGVHYPTDTIAGICAGTNVFILFVCLYEWRLRNTAQT